jgi:hypothetical protein
LEKQKLPSGLDYPNLPFHELQNLILPHTYSFKQFLIYVLEIPLISPTLYQLYKVLPLPIALSRKNSTYAYVNFNKELIFNDPLRQHYGKMSANELSECFHPNEFYYVCKEEIPIYTYVPDWDCEATLLQPSVTKVPSTCEYRILKLDKTYCIPLHMSNEWIFIAPRIETFTVLCPQKTVSLKLQNTGKLHLGSECKGYSPYVTLYAMSIRKFNMSGDYIPVAPIYFDCCFEDLKEINLEQLLLQLPLENIISSVDDLRVAIVKVDEIQDMIKGQELKHSQNLYMIATSWGSVIGSICMFILCMCCSCCCCKCCRTVGQMDAQGMLAPNTGKMLCKYPQLQRITRNVY